MYISAVIFQEGRVSCVP